MENASKALIIAGAILLAILIIGLGVFIYNQASNSIGNTGMDQLEIQTFNAKFEPYIGTQSGAQLKQLLKTIISNNISNSDDDSMQVKLIEYETGDVVPLTVNSELNRIGDTDVFYVRIQKNNKNGIITGIIVEGIYVSYPIKTIN